MAFFGLAASIAFLCAAIHRPRACGALAATGFASLALVEGVHGSIVGVAFAVLCGAMTCLPLFLVATHHPDPRPCKP